MPAEVLFKCVIFQCENVVEGGGHEIKSGNICKKKIDVGGGKLQN